MDMTKYAGNSELFMKAEHFTRNDKKRLVFRIKDWSESTFKDGSIQPTLHFHGTEKILGLNKTNVRNMMRLYGPDSDGWIGKSIAVYVTKTLYEGKEVDCLRIDTEPPIKQIEQPKQEQPQPRRMQAMANPQNGLVTQQTGLNSWQKEEKPWGTLTTAAIADANDDPLSRDEVPF